jgi:lipopolysaccharide cholinephosphotransferase
MKQITDIRELRQLQLAIMDDIHQFCEQNGIRYSLAGGTLIGAFRHQGYIPWDDDIDIYLMRSDYERFLKEYKDKNGRFQLLCPEQTEHYFYTFAKVIDTQTVMIEDETEGYEIGVYVDVFLLIMSRIICSIVREYSGGNIRYTRSAVARSLKRTF